MDIQSQTSEPISDDQELAAVLAGVSGDTAVNLNFEETPITAPAPEPTPIAESVEPETETTTIAPEPETSFSMPSFETSNVTNLDDIKKNALLELRPLVEKLNITAEEKFDIYLLLLRSTDDKTLVAPAHETACKITDEAKRAQSLLDIIKEIDYLSSVKK